MATIRYWHLHNYTLNKLWKTLTFIWGHVSCHLTDTEAFILLSPLFLSHHVTSCPPLHRKQKKKKELNSSENWPFEHIHQSDTAKLRKRFLCSWNIGIVNKIKKIQSICSVCCMYLHAISETERLVSSCNGKSKNLTTCLLWMVQGPAVIVFAE